jgi:hypothetical protein
MTNDRPDLSSERAPYRAKTATFKQQPSDRKQFLVTSPRMGSMPWHNDWLTASCNVTLTLAYLVTSPRMGSIPWHNDWLTVSRDVTSIGWGSHDSTTRPIHNATIPSDWKDKHGGSYLFVSLFVPSPAFGHLLPGIVLLSLRTRMSPFKWQIHLR